MARYTYKKQYTWSADIAYIVGLIASDGCLIGDGRHINITSKDIEIINHFRSILNISSRHFVKQGNLGGTAYHLQFSNVAFYDFLLITGLTPAKSLTMRKLKVPDLYFKDFMRGYFDGDGTIYGYKDSRWPNSHMFYTEFISGSLEFLSWIKDSSQRLMITTNGTMKRGPRAFVLSYAKADSRGLFKAFYSDLNAPKLTRKYDKFVAFLQRDPYAVKE